MLKRLKYTLQNLWVRRSSNSLIQYYRSQGITIGENCIFRSTKNTKIDLMRPSLVTIGNNVDMNDYFTIMTHDFGHKVLLSLYGEFLSSSGAVNIGNNVYFGTNVTILKGGGVGDNCIIGAGTVINKPIPSNSVAAGVPLRLYVRLKNSMRNAKSYGLKKPNLMLMQFVKKSIGNLQSMISNQSLVFMWINTILMSTILYQ